MGVGAAVERPVTVAEGVGCGEGEALAENAPLALTEGEGVPLPDIVPPPALPDPFPVPLGEPVPPAALGVAGKVPAAEGLPLPLSLPLREAERERAGEVEKEGDAVGDFDPPWLCEDVLHPVAALVREGEEVRRGEPLAVAEPVGGAHSSFPGTHLSTHRTVAAMLVQCSPDFAEGHQVAPREPLARASQGGEDRKPPTVETSAGVPGVERVKAAEGRQAEAVRGWQRR